MLFLYETGKRQKFNIIYIKKYNNELLNHAFNAIYRAIKIILSA